MFSGLVSEFVLASANMHVAFQKHVEMKSDELFIKDIVDSEGTDVEFIQKYGNLKITDSNDESETIDRSRIYRDLIKAGADLDHIQFVMNGAVTVERGQKIDLPSAAEQKIIDIVSSTTQVPKADIKIASVRILPKLQDGEETDPYFKSIQAQNLSHSNNTKFEAVVENTDGVENHHELIVAFDVETTVLVANSDLVSGTILSSDKFVAGRQKLKSLDGKILRQGDLGNKTLKLIVSIAKDNVILADDIKQSVVVADGAQVTLSYKMPGLHISTTGIIQGVSEIGQVVRVENTDSNRVVTGRLVSPDLVEVGND